MPHLSYCPNCRRDLTDQPLGWLCWQPVIAAAQSSNREDEGEKLAAAAAAFGKGTTVKSHDDYYIEEDQLCETYNDETDQECRACRKKATDAYSKPACPFCKMELPKMQNIEPFTLTITGPTGSGKTHYIVALNEWWRRGLPRFGLSAWSAMGSRVERTFDSMREGLKKGTLLSGTIPGRMSSFTWQIRPRAAQGVKSMLISLPDVAGERLERTKFLAVNRYYHNTTGIIFLLDGTNLLQCDEAERIAKGGGRSTWDKHFQVATAMIEDIQGRLDPTTAANIPLAVCVNKVDMLIEESGAWRDLVEDYVPNNNGVFDHATCAARSHLIETILHQNEETSAIASLLQANFENLMFFPVATIGSNTEPLVLDPRFVEDPFLFLMWHLDFVR